MKRRLNFEFILMITISLVIFIVGATLIAKSNINNVTKLNLQQYLEVVKTDYNSGLSGSQIIDKYQNIEGYLQITFIESDGAIIADSTSGTINNQISNLEFIDLGNVYIRRSATLDTDIMYLANQLSDGNFVRVAIPIKSVVPFLNDFLSLSIVIGIIITVLSIFSSGVLVKRSLQPLVEIKDILRNINVGEYSQVYPVKKYEEINDLIREINEINKNLSINISSLKSEKQKNDFLLNHMNQGICVLDKDGKIVLLNQYLKNLFHFNIDININKDFRYLFRDLEIQDAIEKACESEINTNTFMKIDQDYYAVSINYLEENWLNQSSVIIMFSDITAIKSIDMLKKEFFVNASHELKSPLTSIIGFSEIISQGMAKDSETIIDLSNKISEEANRMNNLVMDMLTLSQYENQEKAKQKLNLNLLAVLNEVIESLKISAEKNNIKIHFQKNDVFINANHEQMYQLFKNIVENAIKYGKQSGNVWINFEKGKETLMIEVKDDGIGIPKLAQARIFERFFRVDKARSKSTGGTGLGLSIVKHIVLNYEGHIELDSTENVGTTVQIFIPNSSIKLI